MSVDFGDDGIGESFGGGDENGHGHFIVFGLGEQIRRGVGHISSLIGQKQHFTGTGDHVDGNLSEDGAFGSGDKNVAGSDDFVNRRNALGAVSQSRDGLSAAHFIDFAHAGNRSRRQNVGMD